MESEAFFEETRLAFFAANCQRFELFGKDGGDDAVKVGLGLNGGDAGIEPGEDVEEKEAAVLEAGGIGHEQALHGEGNIEVGRGEDVGAAEAGLGDAEDGHRLAVEEDFFVDDGRIRPETALPEGVGEDGDGVGVNGFVVIGSDGTAERGPDAERFEPSAGDEGGGNDLVAVAGGEAGRAIELGGQALDGGGGAEVIKHGVGEAPVGPVFALAGPGKFELDEALGIGEREGAEEELVEEGENGGVGANSDGEGDGSDDCK